MSFRKPNPFEDRMGFAEFVALIALMTTIVAMSIDGILPALSEINRELGSENAPLTVSLFFLGLGVAQFFVGPIADSFGRRRTIYLGCFIYLIGTALCIYAESMSALIMGRVVQGIGAAGPRVAATAAVRDRYEGRMMARVLSLVMMLFIMVPVFAPLIGQFIMLQTHWRGIFWFFGVMAALMCLWVWLRFPETLAAEDRAPFRLSSIRDSVWMVARNRAAMGATLAMGVIFAAFIGFLSIAQPLLGEAYGLGEWFPLTFSALACVIGVVSGLNAWLVMRLGMARLSRIGIIILGACSAVFAVVFLMIGPPPLWAVLTWLVPTTASIGIVFSNLNAIAMEPLGKVAGVAAGAVAAIGSLFSAFGGFVIVELFDGTAFSLAVAFVVCSILALALLRWAEQGREVVS